MQIYYKEISLDEGFRVAAQPKHSRIVAGKEVSLASGFELFKSLEGSNISCWKCGCVADRWIIGRGQNDLRSKPVMNLFAVRAEPPTKKRPYTVSKLVMMTRDHVIPKSFGGVDSIENLRPGCEICNGLRGSNMNKRDKAFMLANPHLISAERAARGAEARRKIELEHRDAVARRRAAIVPQEPFDVPAEKIELDSEVG